MQIVSLRLKKWRGAMDWKEICEYPELQNLPFKIELNEMEQIIMTPCKVYHSLYQAEIAYLLRSLLKNGKTLTECAIKTKKGIKVADVAWASNKKIEKIREETACSISPEICIEIISSSNTSSEMEEKKELYFGSGALEVWTCNQQGNINFYDASQKLNNSNLICNFPNKIDV